MTQTTSLFVAGPFASFIATADTAARTGTRRTADKPAHNWRSIPLGRLLAHRAARAI